MTSTWQVSYTDKDNVMDFLQLIKCVFCFAATENTNYGRNMTPVFCSLTHLQFGRLSLCVAVLGEENILAS